MPVRALTAPLIAFTFSSTVRFSSFMSVHQASSPPPVASHTLRQEGTAPPSTY
jgi:hypothetical protein